MYPQMPAGQKICNPWATYVSYKAIRIGLFSRLRLWLYESNCYLNEQFTRWIVNEFFVNEICNIADVFLQEHSIIY